ncbi:TIGR00296 family protein [Candidatus Woesearchaeota archaeon CG08_land_8_20_14_0_20_47_9]|nr:MAG: hypothetical protein AUJ69_02380 [Candidatus Woesearchaeota archaeon CG1_02_47_18]PIN72393.1 MAG: AMMECR1 domain-containing protein [Candidatus Woesearchaeota archaeon CG10_big_fil_rev_8_21_14_0_10_47_5]PIO04004.1 MAG: TIGR00296 family protein [Candidatus Woesearchaeota archaeon CG08_land_8_20_14_0_20_47_9]HII29487.1 TIGR00296 family protein [Candidatus Woesearchaeota archaeon]
MDKLSDSDGGLLLKLARDAITASFKSRLSDLGFIIPDLRSRFNGKRGVFVTIKKDDMLRGCIGFPESVMPLWKAVAMAAVAAAFDDPRFPPLQPDEVFSLEVSVLTPPEEIKARNSEGKLKAVSVGRDGLIVRKDFYSGLLLPQVFTDYNASPEQALAMTCQKAGLPDDAWMDEGCRIFRFQAQVFSESQAAGSNLPF